LLLGLAGRIAVGHLTIVLPDGSSHVFRSASHPELRAMLAIRDLRAVRRLLLGGATGFGEAYMDGDWDTPDLTSLLRLALANENAMLGAAHGMAAFRIKDRLRHLTRANTRTGSRRNIAYHYDLGNRFYASWLDEGMTYSSALFERSDVSLADAQQNKYRRLAETLELRPGLHLLEIGCGWGGFAVLAAADYGCRVTAITLSREQFEYTRRRVSAAGLSERVEVRLADFRDVSGSYDRIAAIEMFEAVGEKRWPTFFHSLHDRLMSGGIAGLQVIRIEDARFERYRRNADFIQKYIFPGGMLPSPSALHREIERSGLQLQGIHAFGRSYAETLAMWRQRFSLAWTEIRGFGFDERFRRMWLYYLAYCEAGFLQKVIDVAQYRLGRM
jgi:cyclopropane-fatty-acyl-phospholipid synthase